MIKSVEERGEIERKDNGDKEPKKGMEEIEVALKIKVAMGIVPETFFKKIEAKETTKVFDQVEKDPTEKNLKDKWLGSQKLVRIENSQTAKTIERAKREIFKVSGTDEVALGK